jgi:predicted flap endonuclease-1-like 5' DNA nuclease
MDKAEKTRGIKGWPKSERRGLLNANKKDLGKIKGIGTAFEEELYENYL